MNYYTISVSGRGFDCKIFSISDEQVNELSNLKDSFEDALNEETLCELGAILGKDFIVNEIDFFDSDTELFGPDHSNISISVIDSQGNTIYETELDWLEKQFDKLDEEESDKYFINIWESKKLAVAQHCKANFFDFELNIEESFDSSKLKGIITEVGETFNILTGLEYNGIKLEYSDVFSDVSYDYYYCVLMD